MFWPIQRSKKKLCKRLNKPRRAGGRRLLVECLETRQVLSGVVGVSLSAGTLTLLGDQPLTETGSEMPSDNWVEVRQGAATGQFIVTGKGSTLLRVDGSLKETTTVNAVMNIDVQLGQMNDTFELLGATPSGPAPGAKANPALVRGWLEIENDACGVKVNKLVNVLIKYDFEVERVIGAFNRSELLMQDVTVEGAVTIDNLGSNGGGSTSTILRRVEILKQLTITNGADLDTITIEDSNIDWATELGTTINNGPGGSRTQFASTGAWGNTLYGPLTILNGENPIDVPGLQQLDDLVTFDKTTVAGAVLIDNDGGDSRVSVSNDSTLGSNINMGGSLTLQNGAGVDMFEMKNSEATFGVSIDYDYDSSTTAPPLNMYGSTTTIYDSIIGCCLGSSSGLLVLGDQGSDTVEITESTIDGTVTLKLYDGNNRVLIEENAPIQGLTITTGAQVDKVTIRGTAAIRQVVMIPLIELGDSNDTLLLEHVQFLGDGTLDGQGGAADDLQDLLDVIYSDSVDLISW